MPRRGSAPNKQGNQGSRGIQVRDSIAAHFRHLNDKPHDEKYLTRLADDHPASYVALVSKVIPQQAQIEITAHAVDLGAAMLDASNRLAEFNRKMDPRAIDHVPLSIDHDTLAHDNVTLENGAVADVGRVDEKVIDEKRKGGAGDGYPRDRGAAVDCPPTPDPLK